jgi:hypothetical protein
VTKAERVRAALAGEVADRAPFAFWHHFRDVPPIGDPFVRATLDFYDTYDPDLLKVMQDGSYEMPVDTPVYERAEQWRDLPVNPPDSGVFGEQIRSLQTIAAHKSDDAPVLATVTSVFLEAQRITGGRLPEMLDADPDVVLAGLKALAAAWPATPRRPSKRADARACFWPSAGPMSNRCPSSVTLPIFCRSTVWFCPARRMDGATWFISTGTSRIWNPLRRCWKWAT